MWLIGLNETLRSFIWLCGNAADICLAFRRVTEESVLKVNGSRRASAARSVALSGRRLHADSLVCIDWPLRVKGNKVMWHDTILYGKLHYPVGKFGSGLNGGRTQNVMIKVQTKVVKVWVKLLLQLDTFFMNTITEWTSRVSSHIYCIIDLFD